MKRNFLLLPIIVAIILVAAGSKQNEAKPKISREVMTTQIMHDFGSNDASTTSTTPVQAPTVEQPTPPKDTLAIETQLRVGDNGDDVKLVQVWLNKFGYKLVEDGSFGNGTQRILKDFQKRVGISPSGVVDQATVEKLNSTEPTDFGKDYYAANSSKSTTKSATKSSTTKNTQTKITSISTGSKNTSNTSNTSKISTTNTQTAQKTSTSSTASAASTVEEDSQSQSTIIEESDDESYDSASESDEEYNSDENYNDDEDSDDEDSEDDDYRDHHYDHRRRHRH